MKSYILTYHQDVQGKNLGLLMFVPISSKVHLVEDKFQIGLHSNVIFCWWLQKLFSVLLQVLNKYGGILISDLGKRRFNNCIILLVSLLCLARSTTR